MDCTSAMQTYLCKLPFIRFTIFACKFVRVKYSLPFFSIHCPSNARNNFRVKKNAEKVNIKQITLLHRMMESVDPHKAAHFYLATADLHEIEEKHRDAANAVKGAVNMYAKARQ